MGTTSLRLANSRGFTSYNIVRQDTARKYWQLIDNKTSIEYLVKEISQKDVPALQQFAQKKAMLQHENLVSMKDYAVDLNAGVACLLYEFPLRSLYDEMVEKRMFNKGYKQGEIWSIIKAVILGMNYLDKKNIDEKVVRLNTIFISNNGTIKVGDPWILSLESNYELALRHKNVSFPLSPEEIMTIQQNIQTNVGRKKNSDVYSLGMCILEIALVGSQHRIEHYSNYQLYRKSVVAGLDSCRMTIIGLMLEANTHERVGWSELAELIETSASRRVSIESVESCTKTANFALERRQSMEKMQIYVTNPGDNLNVPSRSMLVNNNSQITTQQNSDIFPSNQLRHPPNMVPQRPPNYQYQVNQPMVLPYSNPSLPVTNPINVAPTNITFNIHSVSSPNIVMEEELINRSMDKSQFEWRSSMKHNRILASNISRERIVDSNKASRLQAEQSALKTPIPPAVLESLGSQVQHVVQQRMEQPREEKPQGMPRKLFDVMPQILQGLTMPVIRQTVSIVQPPEQPVVIPVTPPVSPPIVQPPKESEEKSDNSRTPINSIIIHDKAEFFGSYKIYKSVVQQKPRSPEKTGPVKEVFDRQSIIIAKNPDDLMRLETPIKESMRVEAQVQTTPNTQFRKLSQDSDQMEKTVRYQVKFETKKPRYEGDMLRGFRHGKGKYYFQDGGYYDGQWLFNRMQGKGKLYYVSGKIAYEGEWCQDQIHGQGKLYNENPKKIERFDYKDFSRLGNCWSTYEGTFSYDMKEGVGTLTLSNGEVYSGHFKNDKVHGEGVFVSKERAIHGQWNADILVSIL